MSDRNCWETLKAESATVAEDLKKLLHEGNARRVIVTQHDRVVAEFPVTAGVIGIAIAPVVAAIGAMVALLKDCTVHVERRPAAPDAGASAPVVSKAAHS
ncbi:MAG TPA: DUF4342 domain-containing protein [Vicinamibacterales bacterium]|nr:DUF4342 domain-containing protein [Vicinamibacterales bacterium]